MAPNMEEGTADETGDAQPEDPAAGDPAGLSHAAGNIPPTHKEERVFYNRFTGIITKIPSSFDLRSSVHFFYQSEKPNL
jgi:hypothetical protein